VVAKCPNLSPFTRLRDPGRTSVAWGPGAIFNLFKGDLHMNSAPSTPNRLAPVFAALTAAERGPTTEELAAAPVLKLWHPIWGQPRFLCLAGSTGGHPTLGRDRITTSPLIVLAPDLTWARTLSRFYRLEEPLEHALAGLSAEGVSGPIHIADAYGAPAVSIVTAQQELEKLQAELREARAKG
jgi:hypothetical protein